MDEKAHVVGLELTEQLKEVLQRATKPIELEHCHGLHLSAPDVLHELVEDWAGEFGATDPFFGVHNWGVAESLDPGDEWLPLDVNILLFVDRADAEVAGSGESLFTIDRGSASLLGGTRCTKLSRDVRLTYSVQ